MDAAGRGHLSLETVIDDRAGIPYPETAQAASDNDTLPADGESTISAGERCVSDLSALVAAGHRQWRSAHSVLPVVIDTGPPSTDVHGRGSTFYVDLTPPEVAIGPTVLNTDHALGPGIVELAGTASDTVLPPPCGCAHRRRAVAAGWYRRRRQLALPWRLAQPPTGESYAVSVRANRSGWPRPTVVTATVVVDRPGRSGP
ncbi:MAG: hypothetical protein R2851_03260 [Caldilineaceae bacterium]